MNRVVSTLLPLPVHVAAVWLILVLMGLEVRTCLVNHYLTAFLSFSLTLSFYPPLSLSLSVFLSFSASASLFISLCPSLSITVSLSLSLPLSAYSYISLSFPFSFYFSLFLSHPSSLHFPASSSPFFLFSTFFILSRLNSFLIYSPLILSHCHR